MAISEAALAGISANGRQWKRQTVGISALALQLGEINDDERDAAEAEGIVREITAKVRAYPAGDAAIRESLDASAEELECVADCDIDEINDAMNGLYDVLDYWRILA